MASFWRQAVPMALGVTGIGVAGTYMMSVCVLAAGIGEWAAGAR